MENFPREEGNVLMQQVLGIIGFPCLGKNNISDDLNMQICLLSKVLKGAMQAQETDTKTHGTPVVGRHLTLAY
jgi:hypothetical protein